MISLRGLPRGGHGTRAGEEGDKRNRNQKYGVVSGSSKEGTHLPGGKSVENWEKELGESNGKYKGDQETNFQTCRSLSRKVLTGKTIH